MQVLTINYDEDGTYFHGDDVMATEEFTAWLSKELEEQVEAGRVVKHLPQIHGGGDEKFISMSESGQRMWCVQLHKLPTREELEAQKRRQEQAEARAAQRDADNAEIKRLEDRGLRKVTAEARILMFDDVSVLVPIGTEDEVSEAGYSLIIAGLEAMYPGADISIDDVTVAMPDE